MFSDQHLAIPKVSLFEVEDLVLRKNEMLVVNTLLALSKIPAVRYQIKAPLIIQYELEIEQAERAEKEAKAAKVAPAPVVAPEVAPEAAAPAAVESESEEEPEEPAPVVEEKESYYVVHDDEEEEQKVATDAITEVEEEEEQPAPPSAEPQADAEPAASAERKSLLGVCGGLLTGTAPFIHS